MSRHFRRMKAGLSFLILSVALVAAVFAAGCGELAHNHSHGCASAGGAYEHRV